MSAYPAPATAPRNWCCRRRGFPAGRERAASERCPQWRSCRRLCWKQTGPDRRTRVPPGTPDAALSGRRCCQPGRKQTHGRLVLHLAEFVVGAVGGDKGLVAPVSDLRRRLLRLHLPTAIRRSTDADRASPADRDGHANLHSIAVAGAGKVPILGCVDRDVMELKRIVGGDDMGTLGRRSAQRFRLGRHPDRVRRRPRSQCRTA